jgi:hypothetical protein
MTIKMNQHVPSKRVETETPTVVHDTDDSKEKEHKKMERLADRAANKANKTEQQFDEDHNSFTI